MPCGPLADDWLFWDPETIFAYPHSREDHGPSADPETMAPQAPEPEQLDLYLPAPE